ncbi:sensor histidine kinase [Cumulibacter manganitolerans]|uniref:sensor histidine kinase n=1 Tax=Cumulibacter manganitolerans TaxID=1884992 RepID=UPI001295D6BE|nr:ATP-binding protein [Cumulibacter manganitolerans]
MKRLSVRLVASHLAVAVIGGLVTYVLVRLLAPRLYDQATHGMGVGSQGRGSSTGQDQLRAAVASAIDEALLIGVLSGAVLAAVFGVVTTRRLLAPLREMQVATRRLAEGDYTLQVGRPGTAELAELSDDVNALAAALASTEQRRVRLISDVAHELRTPLTVIDGYVEGMIDGVFSPDPERLDQISSEVRKLRRFADDLSTLSRVQEGNLQLHPTEVDLADLVARTSERLQPQFDEAGIDLEVRVARPVVAQVDSDRIAQVISNLLGNALRATRGRPDPRVRIELDEAVGHGRRSAVVTVADNGVGLSADELPKIFERFYRAPRAQSSEGSGIGLTIARDIVRAHGGTLTAASSGADRGTTLTLVLPIRP